MMPLNAATYLGSTLIVELVERDEHERAALARGGRRFNQEILLAALFIGALAKMVL